MAARTIAQIYAELVDIAPTWFHTEKFGRDFLDALAAVFHLTETKVEALLVQVFRSTATGEYLDEIGKELGRPRWLGETADEYRARLFIEPVGVTPNAIRKLLQQLADSHSDGYFIDSTEPHDVALDDGFFLDTVDAVLVDPHDDDEPRQLFWLRVPAFELKYMRPEDRTYLDDDTAGLTGTGAFLGVDAYLDAHQHDTDRRIFKRIWREIEKARAAGVLWGATLDDPAQVAYWNLFEDLNR